MNNPITSIKKAISIVFSSRPYIALGVLSFAVFLTLYAFVLPATYTGGRIGLVSLQFLNFKLGVFAFLFSAAISFIIPFAVYAFRGRANQKSSTAVGSFAGSVLPPLLCCSPFLPSVAALASGLSPFAFRVSGFLQGFIATHETQIYIVISAILVYSVYLNAKQVIFAKRQICEGCS